MPMPAKSCMLAINGLRISQTVLQNRQLKMTHRKQLMPNPLVVINAAPLTHAAVGIVSLRLKLDLNAMVLYQYTPKEFF